MSDSPDHQDGRYAAGRFDRIHNSLRHEPNRDDTVSEGCQPWHYNQRRLEPLTGNLVVHPRRIQYDGSQKCGEHSYVSHRGVIAARRIGSFLRALAERVATKSSDGDREEIEF